MKTPENIEFDELDLAILKHLETDGRKFYSDIAEALGVTISTVSNRVKKMTENKSFIILGFLNPAIVGFKVVALIHISLEPSQLEEAAAEIAEFPEVSWAALFAADFDLAIEVFCRDADHLAEFITQRLLHVPGVRDTRSAFMLKELKLRQPSLDLLESGSEE
ncbi:MAG: Lrp/AsnC family transcriptional regulator [Anaerolineales bacterium]|nr:Lrp/AsnC family transcriptional regulator [Anaerolineales bacterium]